MQLNKQAKINAALLCATALVGAVLVVRAECGNTGPCSNDAEVACHNCTNDVWSTGACIWHTAESGDAFCGRCLPDLSCTKEGTHAAETVTTYTNAMCGPAGCIGGEPQDARSTPNQNKASSCGG